jgi:hypothetical protein
MISLSTVEANVLGEQGLSAKLTFHGTQIVIYGNKSPRYVRSFSSLILS